MKIVYCLNSIRYLGGIQRVTLVKANALADVPGNKCTSLYPTMPVEN